MNSIIEHNGIQTNKGHYTTKRFHEGHDIWTHHDDSKEPIFISSNNVVTNNAYILLYSKMSVGNDVPSRTIHI